MPVIPEYLATPILAFCIAALVMPLLNRLAVLTGFVDHPNARKIHTHPIPLLGGMGVYAGVILTLLMRGSLDFRVVVMMVASFLVMAIGVADDRLDLPSRYRLILQICVAFGLSLLDIRFHVSGIAVLDHAITVLWIVGVINAMNCLDCADGTAGGTCLVVFGALAAVAAVNGRYFVSQAALAGLGGVAGFLVYNVPPARVFMGDTGSTFLGLMAAVLTILAVPLGDSASANLPLAPLLLSIPVFDIVWVHYRRYVAGIRSWRDLLSSTGKDHLPHRLMARGLPKAAVMAVVALLSVLAAAVVYTFTAGLWMGSAMALVSLIALLWHLEENGRIVIRPEDQVALFVLQSEASLRQSALQPEESVL